MKRRAPQYIDAPSHPPATVGPTVSHGHEELVSLLATATCASRALPLLEWRPSVVRPVPKP
jgi:hypothetical protein